MMPNFVNFREIFDPTSMALIRFTLAVMVMDDPVAT